MFSCSFKIKEPLTEVRSGQTIKLEVELLSSESPVKTFALSVPAGNVYQRFTKVDDNNFVLSMTVPYGGGGGTYSANIHAINDNNERSESKTFQVKVS